MPNGTLWGKGLIATLQYDYRNKITLPYSLTRINKISLNSVHISHRNKKYNIFYLNNGKTYIQTLQ